MIGDRPPRAASVAADEPQTSTAHACGQNAHEPLAKDESRIMLATNRNTDGAGIHPRLSIWNSHMITLTEKAAEMVREIAKAEQLEGQGLRIRVQGGGCSGFTYDMYFEEEVSDMDETFESHGIKIYVDAMSAQYLDGTVVDWEESLQTSGFTFNNPNVSGTCSCGSSFAV